MITIGKIALGTLLGATLIAASTAGAAAAADLITGAIPFDPAASGATTQNDLIHQLMAADVRVIRVALTTDNARTDFAKRAYEPGIKIEALIEPQFPKDAVSGSDQSGSAPHMWGGLPLASVDPVPSRAYFQIRFSET